MKEQTPIKILALRSRSMYCRNFLRVETNIMGGLSDGSVNTFITGCQQARAHVHAHTHNNNGTKKKIIYGSKMKTAKEHKVTVQNMPIYSLGMIKETMVALLC